MALTLHVKGHSFRIGAASFAADKGLSDAQVRALGRWKSNTFLKYIRLPSLSSTKLSSCRDYREEEEEEKYFIYPSAGSIV